MLAAYNGAAYRIGLKRATSLLLYPNHTPTYLFQSQHVRET